MWEDVTAPMPDGIRERAEVIFAWEDSELTAYSEVCALFPKPYKMAELTPSQLDLSLYKDYPPELCMELNTLPVSRADIYLTCASYTPWDENRLRRLKSANYDSIRQVCVTKSSFMRLAEYIFMSADKKEESVCKQTHHTGVLTGRDRVRLMLCEAYACGASDIHIEPSDSRVVVKFRIDGELCVQEPVHRADKKAFLDAVKDFALLPLGETKNLADCRFSHTVAKGKTLDFRVAKLPSSGKYENFVLRLLDSEKAAATPLPFQGQMLADFLECLNAESGMIILTGPTGSGKTTTLYSAMSRLDMASLNVRTIEDPIEYRLPKAVQTQIDPNNGVTFASTLRGMLRADPDVIMIGEIRDAETAELAAAASNTGHLVLTTLHTKSAVGVVSRLQDLGLTRGEIQEAVSLVVSQRLFPKLCPRCKRKIPLVDAQRRIFQSYNMDPPEHLYERAGCQHCSNTGVKGRLPLFEFLRFTPNIRELLASGASLDAITAENRKIYESMAVSALRAARDGLLAFDTVYNFG